MPYQLSAFDLLGNPARFFGSQSSPAFTLPLAVDRTYLDIGIDGSDDLYLLSNAGDNSQPADYRIDVYQRDGTPIATLSPGANIPHLAVDYWRSIFAANYTALLDTTTNEPHIDPALDVVEPSIADGTRPGDASAMGRGAGDFRPLCRPSGRPAGRRRRGDAAPGDLRRLPRCTAPRADVTGTRIRDVVAAAAGPRPESARRLPRANVQRRPQLLEPDPRRPVVRCRRARRSAAPRRLRHHHQSERCPVRTVGSGVNHQLVNVRQDISPGGQAAAWGATTSVTAIDPAVLAAGYSGCPSCDLSHSPLPGDPPALGLPGGVPGVPVPTGWNSDGAVVANVGNFTGATMPAALIEGNIEGYQFNGASLAGSDIIAFAQQASFRHLRSAVGTTSIGSTLMAAASTAPTSVGRTSTGPR